MRIKNYRAVSFLVMMFVCSSGLCGQEVNEGRYQTVLKMRPVGYWPVDEGTGHVAHDLTSNENHAVIYHLGWQGAMLDFTGVNQWVEMPTIDAYDSASVSIGGWVYNRTSYDRVGVHFFGNAYRRSGFSLATLYEDRPVLPFGEPRTGVSVCLAGDGVDITCGNQTDAAGSVAAGITLEQNQWQHILYTFDHGVGKLYINGQCVSSADGLTYCDGDVPLVVGIQAQIAPVNQWWNFALDGSVRDLVLFNRAVSSEEVQRLASFCPPAVPVVSQVDISDTKASPESAQIQYDEDDIAELITQLKIDDEPTQLGAVRALAEIGPEAVSAIGPLVDMLEEMIQRDGVYLLRSDDLLRNAVIWALQEIAVDDPDVRAVLGQAVAKPLFDSLDTEDSFFDAIRPLLKQGRYMDALDIYRDMPSREQVAVRRVGELPYAGMVNMKGDRIYRPVLHYEGYTYVVGVEWVSADELAAHPTARDWQGAEDPWIGRLKITKISQDGSQETLTLEGEDFIFRASDAKMHGWSLGVDRDGYFHLIGGMHNWVDPDNYVPGSFEKLGLSRHFEDDNYPTMMYWVSRHPGDVHSFEFVGQRSNPRNIPVFQGLNYMPFERDNNGVLYTFGRIYVQGQQSIGLYRYDADRRRWKALGGHAPDVKSEFPVWADHIIRTGDLGVIRSMRMDHESPGTEAIFWDRGTSWYGFSRGMLRFDSNNRMHFTVPLRAIGADGVMTSQGLYAYSDDAGDSFCRADGTKIESLPMSATPGPGQTDVIGPADSTRVYFDAFCIPAVYGNRAYYWHTGLGRWVMFNAPIGGLCNVFTDNHGIITFRSEGGEKMWRSAGHGLTGYFHDIPQLPFEQGRRYYTNNIDWQAYYDSGFWRSVQAKYLDRVYHPQIVDIDFILTDD